MSNKVYACVIAPDNPTHGMYDDEGHPYRFALSLWSDEGEAVSFGERFVTTVPGTFYLVDEYTVDCMREKPSEFN